MTPLEQITAALTSLNALTKGAADGLTAESDIAAVRRHDATVRSVLETLQKPLLSQAAVRKPLRAYRDRDFVQILHSSGDWIDGYVSSVDRVSGHLHVETAKGPQTIASDRRVRDQKAKTE